MNKAERIIYCKLIKEGYEVHHHGFPDFLAYHRETGELKFIEVKRGYQEKWKDKGLNKSQSRVIQILSKFHSVRIEYVPLKREPVTCKEIKFKE